MGGIVLLGMVTGGRRAGPSVLAASVLVLIVRLSGPGRLVGIRPLCRRGRRTDPAGAAAFAPAWTRGAPRAAGRRRCARRRPSRSPPSWPRSRCWSGWAPPSAGSRCRPTCWRCRPSRPSRCWGSLAAVLAPSRCPASGTVLAHLAAWPAAWIAGVAHVCSGLPLARLPWPTGWWGLVAPRRRGSLAALVRAYAGSCSACRGRCRPGSCVAGVPSRRSSWRPVGGGAARPAQLAAAGLVHDHVRRRPGRCHPRCGRSPRRRIVVDVGPDPDLIDRCLDDAADRVRRGGRPHALPCRSRQRADGRLPRPRRGAGLRDRGQGPARAGARRSTAGWRRRAGRPTVITAGDVASSATPSGGHCGRAGVIASGSVPNNASIVLDVTVAGHEVLLSGDIESEAQAAVSADLRARHFDVVKVPHHGSRLPEPQPHDRGPLQPIALISVGSGNTYGHPAPGDDRRLGASTARTSRRWPRHRPERRTWRSSRRIRERSALACRPRHGMLPSS